MSKETKQRDFKVEDRRSSQQAPQGGPLAPWFNQHISRRSAGQRIGKGLAWTAALGMAGVTVYKLASGSDNEVSQDSLDLQRKEGWNVGSTDKALPYSVGLTATDSLGKTWAGLDPNYLISIYQPRSTQWQPFFVPTLIQSLAQPSLNSQVRMVATPEMKDTYERAEGLRALISQAPNANQTLIISDLAGPSSIALGAQLADTANLVPVFDNWPHPLGVVHSHETLGALVYYANEVQEKRAKLPENAPALMLLDSTRLANYTSEDTQFDNRYLAKLPPADQLKQRGINNIIYLVKDQTQQQELDDINDDFVEWQKQGINVRMLRLSDFKPYDDPNATIANTTGATGAATTTLGTPGNSTVEHRHYYYGGSPLWTWFFMSHYGYGYPSVWRDPYYGGRSIPRPASIPRPNFDPPPYRPASRPTVFSSSRVGGSSGGVGRSRPSGFGRTSVRTSSDGHVTGVRSGRSGSYGRSGGGWFGG